MSKSQQASVRDQYYEIVGKAHAAATKADFITATRLAKQAWNYVIEVMKYEKRYESKTIYSVPCIDLVLRIAPVTMDMQSLEELQALLKSNRAIDREAVDDLGARLDSAKAETLANYDLWKKLSTTVRLSALTKAQRETVGSWILLGLARSESSGDQTNVRRNEPLNRVVAGVCTNCGASRAGVLIDFLCRVACKACGRDSTFFIEERGS
jgi:hypothetical protein